MANVLVVDDIAIMRNVIKRHIIKLGHTVVAEAENGVKNGIDALKLIKEFDSNAKVVMVTSHGEEKLVMEALTNGAKGYILKPVNEEKLRTLFSKLVVSSMVDIFNSTITENIKEN